MRWLAIAALALLVVGCGPNLGSLEKGEQASVSEVSGRGALQLDSGLRVFLAEVDLPRGDAPYAQQARQELESLAAHRKVQLGYGGAHCWTPRPRRRDAETATGTTTDAAISAAANTATASTATTEPDDSADDTPGNTASAGETAIAHVFVQSEGGRWIWLQKELILRGAAFVRTRRDNHARAAELLAAEADARAAHRGLWAERAYAMLSPRAAADAAAASPSSCRGNGRYAFVEGRVAHANVGERRASLDMDGGPFSIAIFGQGFSTWDGPAFNTFEGKRVRVRGPLGMFHDAAQICIDHAQQIELVN